MKYRVQLLTKNPAKGVTWTLTAKDVLDLATQIANAYPGAQVLSARELL